MKKLLLLLSLIPSLVFAAAGDTIIDYRTSSNSLTQRILVDPGQDKIYYFSNLTNRPELLGIGQNLSITSGVLNANVPTYPQTMEWGNVTEKPTWVYVFDGSWDTLTNKPSIPPAVTTIGWAQVTGKPFVFPPSYHNHSSFDISDMTAVGRDFVTAVSWQWIRSILSHPGDPWDWMNGFNGSYDSLTGKPSLFSGNYNDLSNKPTIQSIQRVRAQTNTIGTYTWTYPSPYGTGETPVIGVTVEDGSSSSWNHQITAISNTSVTIQLTKTTAVTVLGVSVLGVASNPQAFVHITAVAP